MRVSAEHSSLACRRWAIFVAAGIDDESNAPKAVHVEHFKTQSVLRLQERSGAAQGPALPRPAPRACGDHPQRGGPVVLDPVAGSGIMAAAFARVNLRLTYATPKLLTWFGCAAVAAVTICATPCARKEAKPTGARPVEPGLQGVLLAAGIGGADEVLGSLPMRTSSGSGVVLAAPDKADHLLMCLNTA